MSTEVLKNKDFRKLFIAAITSTSGRTIANASLIWFIFAETDSSLDIAYYGIASTVAAIIFSLVTGTFVDRYNRRQLMILADCVRGSALIVLTAILMLHGFDLTTIIVISFIISSFSVLYSPAEYTLVPEIVSSSGVSNANGILRSARSIIGFVSNSAAGILIVSVGAILGLAYNSATFLVSAFFLILISSEIGKIKKKKEEEEHVKSSYFQDLREGFQWLSKSTGLLELTLSALFLNFFFYMAIMFLVVFSTDGLHQSGLIFGVLLALFSIGDATGALLVGRLGSTRYAGKAWTLPYGVGCGSLLLLMSSFVNVYLSLAAALVMGVFLGFSGTSWLSAAQKIVPPYMQGRYFGIDNLGSIAIMPVAQIIGALLIGSVGVAVMFSIAGMGCLISGVVFILLKDLRHLSAQ